MGAPSTRRLHRVRDASVLQLLDALEREGWARAVANEALAALVVVRCDAPGAVPIEAVVPRREARLVALEVLAGALAGRAGPAEERACREREGGEGIDGRLRRRVVAALLHGALVEVAALVKPGEGPSMDAAGPVGDVDLRRRRRLVHAHAPWRRGATATLSLW
jgi:hypothetical protein